MRRRALPLLFLVACASAEGAGEHIDQTRAPFTSAQATLVDFEMDGRLVADTQDPSALRTLVQAQLLFTVGQLNGERSVGRLGALELSDVTATLIPLPPLVESDGGVADPDAGAPAPPPPPPRYDVRYHARMPVAWAGATKPAHYTFTLPASVGESDQESFTSKYGTTCVDPTMGDIDVGHMFLAYRPQQQGCAPSPEDVVTIDATVTDSATNTHGKYPEYHRVWADNVLRIVALFSRENPVGAPADEGVAAYDQFLWKSRVYLAGLQPDPSKRIDPTGYAKDGVTRSKIVAELPDRRTVRIDVALVGTSLADEASSFDDWYDGLTPSADMILYNGHAGLGTNVSTLMGKGTFQPGQYLVWFANGCDTFAYVDRTLVDRRALLNADDPEGTKYMDTVTNVMAGYFGALEATSMTFIQALVDARDPTKAPKTYDQILSAIDPDQEVVVSGEEDNVLEPLPAPPPADAPNPELDGPRANVTSRDDTPPDATSTAPAAQRSPRSGGCTVGSGPSAPGAGIVAFAFALAALRRRRAVRS